MAHCCCGNDKVLPFSETYQLSARVPYWYRPCNETQVHDRPSTWPSLIFCDRDHGHKHTANTSLCQRHDLKMDSSTSKMAPQTSLFQVYLRLRPTMHQNQNKATSEPWLITDQPSPKIQESQDEIQRSYPTHITLQPPHESRKRAIERFGFTKVFPEEASQLDVFEEISAIENIQNVLKNGRDGLIATLGVTGSGKVRLSIVQTSGWRS